MLNRKNYFRSNLRTALMVAATGLVSLAVTGCFENNAASKFGTYISGTSSTTKTAANTLALSNVGIVASSTSSNGYLATVYFTPTTSTTNISTYCNSQTSLTATTGNVCLCNYSWSETNTTSGSAVAVQRGVTEPVLNVQSSLVTCNAPDTFSNILNGTVISVSIIPGTGNANSFATSTFNYTKASAGASDFQDAQGDSFQDILRYTCFEQYYRGLSVASQLAQLTNPTGGGTASPPLANSFCVQTANGNPSATTCANQLPAPDYSSQSYYYNLYIRDSEQGDINIQNQRYFCPTVQEALGNNGTVGTENKQWPLDRTFALSLGATTTFNLGVQAFTELSDGSSDPTSQGSTCGTSVSASPSPGASSGSSSSASNGSTLVSSCLGFAAAANSDGTCPSFKASNGQNRQTYRLRRYIAVYPTIFDADGTALAQAQSSDTIYVLDRPVTGPNPSLTYTMAGPKPCPWSYYDRSAATGSSDGYYSLTNFARPGYTATNNSSWNGKNIDGAQFPYVDSVNSCSAVIPIPNSTKTAMTLGTVNASNPIYAHYYIRGVSPWAPHYVEDTSFQACAPQSSTIQDPPLHFSKDTNGNVGWCAEVYPSQNPNIAGIDPANAFVSTTAAVGVPGPAVPIPTPTSALYGGDVVPFTSHVVKNSASGACTPTIPSVPTGYPSGVTVCANSGPLATTNGQSICAANHPNYLVADPNAGGTTTNLKSNITCDRTATTVAGEWTKFPLLAPPADVEAAITADISNYGCLITYDNGAGKTGLKSPSGGCCASPSVTLKTGTALPSTAHLEPNVSCLTPTY